MNSLPLEENPSWQF